MRHIVECSPRLCLHIIRLQLVGLWIQANLSRNIQQSLVDSGVRVGSNCFGSVQRGKSLHKFRHDSVNNQCNINKMTQIILTTILNKIKSISKECNMISITDTTNKNESQVNPENYIKALDIIRGQLIKFRQLEDQYYRLESILQKMEADNRQKVAFEQQIKIYNDTLKAQIEEIQMQKLQLLQNSKRTIKQLKKVNQELFAKLNSKVSKNEKNQEAKEQKNEVKNLKTDRVRSFGGKTSSNAGISHKVRVTKEEEIKQIVKTEFIEREQLSQLAKNKSGQDLQEYLDTSELKNGEQNGNMNPNGGKTDREIIIAKKKQRKIHSNTNLSIMLRSNRRHQQRDLKEIYLPKTPEKKMQAKKPKNKLKNINRSIWKDKLANRSVQSLASMQPVLSNKETL